MLEGDCAVRLGGVDVFRNTGAEQQFAAMAVFHQQFQSAQRTVVLAYDVGARCPCHLVFANRIAVLVGTIDEAFVLPSVTPGVGDNPGSYFVFFNLTYFSVAVQVKLNAVVIAADGNSMVVDIAPGLDVFHAGNSGCLVGF